MSPGPEAAATLRLEAVGQGMSASEALLAQEWITLFMKHIDVDKVILDIVGAMSAGSTNKPIFEAASPPERLDDPCNEVKPLPTPFKVFSRSEIEDEAREGGASCGSGG